nr:nitrilase-related carbon-nitrogen hydrolase [Candidatus Sigynarchaeota archaeon]
LVLPELFATGYAFTSINEAKSLAEPTNGLTFDFLSALSQKTGAAIVAGFAERDIHGIYNAAMMVDKGKLVYIYRKVHLFNKENAWFAPGNQHFKINELDGMKVGIMICFDWMFPEAARSLALLGVEIIAHPANLVLPYCQDAMVTRCLENKVYAITANRIGSEKRGDDNFKFTGQSQITGCDGKIIDRGPVDQEKVTVVEIDIQQARDKRINAFNDVLGDRRPSMYDLN